MAKWVQHISGQGEKYKVKFESPTVSKYNYYQVEAPHGDSFYLPKSDYVEYAPPEEWGNITHKLRLDGGKLVYEDGGAFWTFHELPLPFRYRLACGLLVIEMRKP